MSKASEKVYKDIERYLGFMAAQGKTPSQITVTRAQHDTVLKALRTKAKSRKKSEVWLAYKGIRVAVV